MFTRTAVSILFVVLSASPLVFAQAPEAQLKEDRELIDYKLFVSGLENPWGMAFLPDGDILVTEKEGFIRVIRDGKLLSNEIDVGPNLVVQGQGGLMDIELDPDFKKNRRLFLSFASKRGGGDGANTEIVSAEFRDFKLVNQKLIYKASPNLEAGQHFGSRFAIQDGHLYFSIGDRGNRDLYPQRVDLDNGKVYRVGLTGAIPKSNPHIEAADALPQIYSYGHRNPQGLGINPQTGTLWSHEHGPRGGDEVNIIKAGR